MSEKKIGKESRKIFDATGKKSRLGKKAMSSAKTKDSAAKKAGRTIHASAIKELKKKVLVKKSMRQEKLEKKQGKKKTSMLAGKSNAQNEPVVLEPNLLADKKAALEGYEVIVHPMITEKSVTFIESENKLVFLVNKNSSKQQIKKAVEGLYGVKVDKVNVLIDTDSRKRAFVKIAKEFKASEIATKLGVL